jgi:hypothetical protein
MVELGGSMLTSRVEPDDDLGSHLQKRIGMDTTEKNIMCSVEVEALLDFSIRSQQNMCPCDSENESV